LQKGNLFFNLKLLLALLAFKLRFKFIFDSLKIRSVISFEILILLIF